MEGCTALAEVVIETAANPATPWFVCSYSGGVPAVCGASISYHQLLRDPAFKSLNKRLAENGCTLAVQAGEKICRIAVVEGAKTAKDIGRTINHVKRTYRALDTPSGVQWLIRYLGTQ